MNKFVDIFKHLKMYKQFICLYIRTFCLQNHIKQYVENYNQTFYYNHPTYYISLHITYHPTYNLPNKWRYPIIALDLLRMIV